MISIARAIARTLLPTKARAFIYRQYVRAQRMRAAADFSFPLILKPTYADDGLISQHVCDFLSDPKFVAAYAAGRSGVPWAHPGDIEFRAYTACWAAQHALKLDGDFVECGVCSGVLARTICTYLDFKNVPKKYYLFDTFHGIPIETLTDADSIETATRLNKSSYAEDVLPIVRERFADCKNVVIVPGILPGTLDSAPQKISYLYIDLNNATAEIGSITRLWDRLVPGAVVLLDDYAYGPEFMNQKRAWDEFAASKTIDILTLPTGQGMLIKL